MVDVRVVELPACRMVTSGTCTDLECFAPDGLLMSFGDWWAQLDARRTDRFFPRDFMWHDEELKGLVWWYALPDDTTPPAGWKTVDFRGGLYATAACRDQDEADGERVAAAMRRWVDTSGALEYDDTRGHAELFRVITPQAAAEALGYQQLERFLPVRIAG